MVFLGNQAYELCFLQMNKCPLTNKAQVASYRETLFTLSLCCGPLRAPLNGTKVKLV